MPTTTIARWMMTGFFVLATAGAAAAADSTSLNGLWDATVVANGVDVPFRFAIGEDAGGVNGSFFNGDLKITSTGGRFENGALTLQFEQYGSRVEATFKDGRLEGQYVRAYKREPYPFRAVKHVDSPAASGTPPAIDGVWIIPTKSSKGETAWRFIVRQSGPDVSGAILRVDGDTGDLTGSYRDGKFVLSHFSGGRPLLLEVTVEPDGTLSLLQNRQTKLVAVRETSALAKESGGPTDPSRHTSVKDSNERFRFSFPDLNGKPITDEDPRFVGKVVLVSITGSWCPNCHDEAPFLSELYRTYRSKGLEIVALSFEDEDQLGDPYRLRAFIAKYGLDYTVLLAGIPDQLSEKVPQAVNLNAFPTTFFLGKDGRVRSVHAGFPSPGSGKFYTDTKHEITELVERLLAEPAPKSF